MINHIPGAVVRPPSLKALCEYLLEHRPQHYGHPVERYGIVRRGPRYAVRARIGGRPTWVFYDWLEVVLQQVEEGRMEGPVEGPRSLDIM